MRPICDTPDMFHAPAGGGNDIHGAVATAGLAAMPTTPRRILLVASAGGHWLEMCRLAEAFAGFDCLFACTIPGLVAPVGARPVAVIADGSRKQVRTLFRTALAFVGIVGQFRPEIVLTTGAAPGAVALVVARLMGAHTIWIESVASRDELSMSGRYARRFADLFLTQWPALTAHTPSAQYIGQVL